MSPILQHELHTHGRALRALARALVGDQHADDLVQDVALQALRQRQVPRAPVAWLASVLRHLAGKQRRTERRRVLREQRAARPEALPAADREPELGDTLRQLTDAVLALPQPYREVVLLRYLRDLPPPAIAERIGAPLATVKSQLQRGLGLLRARLDASGGGRDWRGAMGAVFGLEPGLPVAGAAVVASTGVFVMGTAVKVGLVALVVALAAGSLWWPGRQEQRATEPGSAVAAAVPTSRPGARGDATTGGAAVERTALPGAAPAAPDLAFAAAMEQLRKLDVKETYRVLLEWFARDPVLAERLVRAILEERIAAAEKSSLTGAVLAAWLDAGAPAALVVDTALANLEVGASTTSGFPTHSFQLALALGTRLSRNVYGLPALDPRRRLELVDALLRVAGEQPLPTRTGAAVAMALQQAPAGDQRVVRALIALARSNADYDVRGSAVTALGGVATPDDILAVFGAAPMVVVSEQECRELGCVLAALLNASNRTGDRRALQSWARGQLSVASATEHQVRVQADILAYLEPEDVRALRQALGDLAEHSPSSQVQASARAALQRVR